MAPQEIKPALKETPFMPFKLVLSDGKSYDVLDSSDASVDLMLVYIGVDPNDESGLFKRSIRVSPNHVVRIEPLPELKVK